MMLLLNILTVIAISFLYFEINWHYWFIKLLNGYFINNTLFIMVLFFAFVMPILYKGAHPIKKRKTYYLLILLFLYIFLASVSIIFNEEEFNNIRKFHVYLFTPIMIFISILGTYIYRKNENIKTTLITFYLLGIIFSVYAFLIFSTNPESILETVSIETSAGSKGVNTGGTFEMGDLKVIRYTVPGMTSSTSYGPILVPLIFSGLYFRKISTRGLKYFHTVIVLFLIFSVIKTGARGPVVALIAGMIYFMGWRWLRPKEIFLGLSILAITILTIGKTQFLRLYLAFSWLIPSLPFMNEYGNIQIEDIHVLALKDSLLYIYQNPFLGIGPSILNDVDIFPNGSIHNNYLKIATSFGLLDLIFYILFVLSLFIVCHRNLKKITTDQQTKDIGIVLNTGVLSFIFFLNFASTESFFFWIWFGFAMAWARNCEVESQTQPRLS